MKIQGKDIVLSVNGRPIAASKGCSIQVQQEFVEACSPTDGRAKKVVPGAYGWTASAECLCNTMVDADTFVDFVENGTELAIRLTDTNGGFLRTGKAYVQSVSASGNVRGLAAVQLSLQGNGALSDSLTYVTGNVIADGVYLTFDDRNFISDPDCKINVYDLVLTKKTLVRLVFVSGSGSVDLMKTDSETLTEIVDSGSYQDWSRYRLRTINSGGTAHTDAIILEAGEYCFCYNDYDVVKVGAAVNSTSTLSEE